MQDHRQHLLAWLRDAHAMEEQAQITLLGQIQLFDGDPELRAKLIEHRNQTQRHAEEIRLCSQRHNDDPLLLREMAAKFAGFMRNTARLFAGDQHVRSIRALYSFEHVEIACYRTLITAAEAAGEHDIKRVCELILAEEEAMADWLRDRLPLVTQEFLLR